MGKPISQAEARRYRKRATELERILDGQRNAWSQTFPNGTNIGTTSAPESTVTAIRTARKLGHAVVVVQHGSELLFYALPHPKENGNE